MLQFVPWDPVQRSVFCCSSSNIFSCFDVRERGLQKADCVVSNNYKKTGEKRNGKISKEQGKLRDECGSGEQGAAFKGRRIFQ